MEAYEEPEAQGEAHSPEPQHDPEFLKHVEAYNEAVRENGVFSDGIRGF